MTAKRKGARRHGRHAPPVSPPPSPPARPARKSASTLSPRRQAFVAEYLKDLNATQAVIRAGYSRRGANVQGVRLLANATVQAALQARMAARAQRLEVSADQVVAELVKIGFSDIRTFTSWGPTGVLFKDSATLEDAACVAEVSSHDTPAGTAKRIRLYDKTEALQLLGKHLGVFPTTKVFGRDGKPLAEVPGESVVIYLPDNGRPVS